MFRQDLECLALQPGVIKEGVETGLSLQNVTLDLFDLRFGTDDLTQRNKAREATERICDSFVEVVPPGFGAEESISLVGSDRK